MLRIQSPGFYLIRRFSHLESPAVITATAPDAPTGFEIRLRVYWEDTDAGGIVYHANYVKFMERARSDWLRAQGVGQQDGRERFGGMFVVTELSLRYLQPARLDDWLVVTAELESMGRASMAMVQRVFRLDEATGARTELCVAQVRVGWVDAHTVRPARIPHNVQSLFT